MMLRRSLHPGSRPNTAPRPCPSHAKPSFIRPWATVKSTPEVETQQTEAPDNSPSQQPVTATAPVTPGTSQPSTPAAAPAATNGRGIAAGAVLAAVAAFAASNLLTTEPTLASLERVAVPLDIALHNGKPTVLEFYADWCEVCKSLVPDELALQREYGNRVNFVMLNIENSKWAQEAADFRVNGIPHFVFLDKEGTAISAAVGRVPKQILEKNLSSLADGQQLPFAAVREQTSPMAPPAGVPSPRQAMPRDHA